MIDLREKLGLRGRVALARALGITVGAIYQWRRVPVERVLDVERITGVSRCELRPDIYPRDDRASAVERSAN